MPTYSFEDEAPVPAGKGYSFVDDEPAAPAATGVPMSRLLKLKKGALDPVAAASQLITRVLPDSVVSAGARLSNRILEATGMPDRIETGGIADLVKGGNGASGFDKIIRDDEAKYQKMRAAAGESGFDGYRTIGSVLPSLALGAATGGVGTGATLAGRVGLGAVQGAASGALSPVYKGDFWAEKAKQVGAGAALGGAIPGVLSAAARVVSPKASTNLGLKLLQREGVQPTVGQAVGGRVGAWEEKLQSAPVLGDMISKARNGATTQFERAAHNRALRPLGMELPEGLSGREAVNFTESALSRRYDEVLGQIGAVPADRPFVEKLASLGQLVNKDVLSKDAKTKFGTIMSDVQSAFDRNGVLTSEGFKRVESQLGSDFRKLTSSNDIYDGRLAPAVKQLQEELRGLLRRQAGDSADDLQAANAAWANFKRAQGAAGKIGAEDGKFTPAQFLNSVRGLDKSKDKAAFARGDALGQDLGDAGKAILTNKVPNSGTADRSLANMLLVGGTAINPAVGIGAVLGSGLYTRPAQRALLAAVSARPAAAQPAAEALRNSSPVLVPGLVQLLLNNSR